ncbi:MAG: DUF6580 family putative transport protein [Patescibacteria group bacterium]|jgi:hypothetical protein
MSSKTKILLAILVIALAAGSRLIDHPFNFTPIAAMSIFAGCYFHKRWGVLLPLLAMVLSDYIIGFYHWPVMISVYLGVALSYYIGWQLARNKKWPGVLGASVFSSVLFFLLTNFSVWAFFNWYPHTLTGLLNCFTLALPFFRNSLAGDLTYTLIFFGAFEAVLWAARVNKKAQLAENS